MRTLPKDFFFGAAFSGPQTEGAYKLDGKLENIWDTWSDERIGDFYNQVGSYVGNDFYHRYESDIQLLKSLGLTSFRTSIQWSRLLDQDGKINPEGAAFYHKLLACAKENGMEVFINLYHFDMPTYLFRRGGWESREVVEAYAHYAEQAFTEFAGEVKYWFTFNEPIVEPEQRYREGFWYPFVQDIGRSIATQYHIALAHSLATAAFRRLQKSGVIPADVKIGLINCFAPPYTRENPSPADLEAVRMEDGLHNRWWLDLVAEGHLPQDVLDTLAEKGAPAPIRPGDNEIFQQGIVDWLGFNYYQPKRVQAPKQDCDANGNPVFSEPYLWPERRINKSRGWEIYPKGIYDFGMVLKENYPNLTFFISENGMDVENEDQFRDANGVIQDDYRIDFVREHLEWIAQAIEEGARCQGYHYWAVIDNWSWANAFKNRYGFVEVRLQDGYNRRCKKSAEWLTKVAISKEIV